MNRGTSSTGGISILNEAIKTVATLNSASAGTGYIPMPLFSGSRHGHPLVAWEGEHVDYLFGTAQVNNTDYVHLTVIEYDLDEIITGKKLK